MDPTLVATLDALHQAAAQRAERAYVPYSGRPVAAALLLSDGGWVAGVRVESASYSLVIPALVNAYGTAVASGRADVVAVAMSRPWRPEEAAFLHALGDRSFAPFGPHAFTLAGQPSLPSVGEPLAVFLDAPLPASPAEGVALARRVAERAHVAESGFRVGCVLEAERSSEGARLVPGVNVEHGDWSRILCAERNALGTAASEGLRPRRLYLSAPDGTAVTPCGACRQLLMEQAPTITLFFDRRPAAPASSSPPDLLPDAFTGDALERPSHAAG